MCLWFLLNYNCLPISNQLIFYSYFLYINCFKTFYVLWDSKFSKCFWSCHIISMARFHLITKSLKIWCPKCFVSNRVVLNFSGNILIKLNWKSWDKNFKILYTLYNLNSKKWWPRKLKCDCDVWKKWEEAIWC